MKQKNIIREVVQFIQPRERLFEYGEKSLSEQELLAIILRTGTQQVNVLELSMIVLNYFQTLNNLKYASLEELQKIKGIGPTKAIELKAAIEFGYRVAVSKTPRMGTILSTNSAGQWLIDEMGDLHQEQLMAIFLNTKNQIIHKQVVFKGTLNNSIAHPREIFKEAVKYPTARIIVAHNHPSGEIDPSPADINFTRRLILCGDMMGIELLDHLIIGQDKYYSLRENSSVFEDN